jgi:carbamoyl-phosphate synthase large subunit
LAIADDLGYPVLIRPSFILGGRGVEIVESRQQLRHYLSDGHHSSSGYPLLIDRFLDHALELDVDVLTDGQVVWIAGLMEQVEEAGIHSGDSACVLPPVSLSTRILRRIEREVSALVLALGAIGLVNVQLAIRGDELYVLEANPRASRTVPFVSKAIGIPLAKLAAKLAVGRRLADLLAPYWPFPIHPDLASGDETLSTIIGRTRRIPIPWPAHSAVKEVVLPFGRFPGADPLLGPEMRSTGEVMGFGPSFPYAFAKAQAAAGNPLPDHGTALVSLADTDKREGVALATQLHDQGFQIIATRGTARSLESMGIPVTVVAKVGEGRPNVVDLISQGHVDLVVNTSSPARGHSVPQDARPVPPLPPEAPSRGVWLPPTVQRTVGYRIREAALDNHVPYVTTLVALRATVAAIRAMRNSPPRALSLTELTLAGLARPGTNA